MSVFLLDDAEPYGEFISGTSNVVFVVPHGPDEHEAGVADLVREVVLQTNAAGVLNTKVARDVCDCNNIRQLMTSHVHAAKRFYADLMYLLRHTSDAVVVFVHYTPRYFNRRRRLFVRNVDGKLLEKRRGEARDWDIDIGCGLSEVVPGSSRIDRPRLLPAWTIKRHLAKTRVTCHLGVVQQMQRQFEHYQLRTCIGREWPAINRQNMTQFVASEPTVKTVVQLEIINDLHQRSSLRYALKSVVRRMSEARLSVLP